MEGIAETVENVGLAQEIQNGLAKSLQTEPKWPASEIIQAKRKALAEAGEASAYGTDLGRYVMDIWARAAGMRWPSDAVWTAFVESKAFDLFAKYEALADSTAGVPAVHKQFSEARALGRGAFGVVFLVFKKDTGMALATKKIVKGLAKQNNMVKSVCVEQAVLAKVRSRFCVGLHYSYQDDICVYLTLSLCPGGDLWFLLQQRSTDPRTGQPCDYQKLDMPAIRFYTASMACGLQAIHEAGYVYRDLKPHNVLLDAEGQLRISDMGLCVDISKGPVTAENDPLGPSIRHGTCGYWPPEVIREEPYTTAPDWWALGITAFQLFCDRLPFFGMNDDEKNEMILQAEEKLPGRFTHGEPPEFQTLIYDFLNVKVPERLGSKGGLAQIKAHPFFAGYDWEALETGRMEAPIKPNVNDINAPSKSEIEAMKPPKGITWDPEDQAHFHSWEHQNRDLMGDEAICRIRKRNELAAALSADGLKMVEEKPKSGGGCCCMM